MVCAHCFKVDSARPKARLREYHIHIGPDRLCLDAGSPGVFPKYLFLFFLELCLHVFLSSGHIDRAVPGLGKKITNICGKLVLNREIDMDPAADFTMFFNGVNEGELHCEDLAARLLVEKFESLLVENENMRRTIETQVNRIAALEKANASLLRSFSSMCDDRAKLLEVSWIVIFLWPFDSLFYISDTTPYIFASRCQCKYTEFAASFRTTVSGVHFFHPWTATTDCQTSSIRRPMCSSSAHTAYPSYQPYPQ
jgi:hypothetical protein